MGGRTALSAFATLLLLQATAAFAQSAYDAAAWRSDYAGLKRGLEDHYANLTWFGSPSGGLDLPALDRKTVTALDAAATDAEASSALKSFLKAFPDGHLQALPLGARPVYVVEDQTPPDPQGDPGQGCDRLGYKAPARAGFSLPFESAASHAPLLDDGVGPLALVGSAGDRVGLLRLPSFWMKHYPTLCRRAWLALQARGSTFTPDDLEREIDWVFAAAIASDLKRLRAAGARTLLVDLGGNGGGDSSGDLVTRLFSKRPVFSARLWTTPAGAANYLDEEIAALRVSRAGADGLSRVRHDQSLALHDARRAGLRKSACDLSWVWRERRPWSLAACSGLVQVRPIDPRGDLPVYERDRMEPLRGAWRGQVYVLIDRDTASSAEMFAAMLRDNGVARLIGDATYGAGCGNIGDMHFIDLPHAGLRIQAPNCVRQRLDGSNEVEGLRPDIPVVAPSAADRARQVLDRILADGRSATGRVSREQDEPPRPR